MDTFRKATPETYNGPLSQVSKAEFLAFIKALPEEVGYSEVRICDPPFVIWYSRESGKDSFDSDQLARFQPAFLHEPDYYWIKKP